jgi:TetR/AcrR family tetracycline transcriptional repressor
MALSRDQVLTEALHLCDEAGLDALSLRTLARRLGVQAPTLYWHISSKAAMLDALSDAIMAEAIEAAEALPVEDDAETWRNWLFDALIALRSAMLHHRDGARIVSGARDSLRRAEFSELAMSILIRQGTELRYAWLLVLAGERYTLGHVLAEQGPDAAPSASVQDEFQSRFPTVARGVSDYFAAGNTADDLFKDGLRILIGQRNTC